MTRARRRGGCAIATRTCSSTNFKTPIAKDPKRQNADDIGLGTLSGATIALQLSEYRYQEHVDDPHTDFIHELGGKGGIDLSYTGKVDDDWFITGDVRGAFGWNQYTGALVNSQTDASTPLKKDGIPDYILDMRLLGGSDFIFDDALWGLTNFGISPYSGLGFRLLYNQGSAISLGGYDRYSHYFYIPVGETTRFKLTDASRLAINGEFDYMVYGWQESDLSDNNAGGPDLINPQWHGIGLRGSVMWEWKTWGFGPFVDWWNIGDSKTTTSCGAYVCEGGREPDNQTLEGGVQVQYKF